MHMIPFRASGVLLHPTSLPSRYGVGELGPTAREFIDFLAATGQQFWQVLPLGPTGYGNSPYMCYSAIAGNPLLISLEVLREQDLLTEGDFWDYPEFPTGYVDFDRVIATKMPLLRRACDRFFALNNAQQQADFRSFCATKNWLPNYALFMALKAANQGASWYQWDPALAHRKPAAIEAAQAELAIEIRFHQYLQFEFYHQWNAVKSYANTHRISIIGDIPIYVAHDSADVWAHPENFQLDQVTGEVVAMAGVPPDYFSETGQLWGNPVYNWTYLEKTDFQWWIDRFSGLLDYVDWIRVDHFRGFEAFWAVPQGEETAMNGVWVDAPGRKFFEILRDTLGKLPILAEDLGVITPPVEALRDDFDFAGMRVLHFAFGGDAGNSFLPFNYVRNCVVYTGTHDNDTTVGWWNQLSDYERDNVVTYIGQLCPEGIHWDLIRLALASIANLAIIPMQDLLGLDGNARMNFPGRPEGNWGWRYDTWQMQDDAMRSRLARLTGSLGRWPNPLPAPNLVEHVDLLSETVIGVDSSV